MHVIFVEPSFPRNQKEFVRALASIGAGITGIGERPVDQLDTDVKTQTCDGTAPPRSGFRAGR